MKENKFQIKKSVLLDIAFCLFFAVATNADWMSNPFLWWGVIALVFFTQFLLYRGKICFGITKYKLWWGIFLIICVVSVMYSINRSDSVAMIKTLIILAIMMVYVESELKDIDSIHRMMKLYVIGIGITLCYVLITQDVNQFQLAQIGEGNTGRWNGNDIGMNAAVIVTMSIYLLPKTKKTLMKIGYLLINLVSLYLIYWMGSRKTIIFLILSICGIILLKKPRKLIRNILIVLCIVAIAWNAVLEIPALYQNVGWRLEALMASVTGKGAVDSSTLLREKYIEVGIESFKESPVVGYGINTYREINQVKTGHRTYSHNNFIEIAVGLGIVGIISYYWLYIYLIVEYIKKFIRKQSTFLINVLFILFGLYLSMQVGLVSYEGITQWMLLLLLYKALCLNRQKILKNI